MKTQSHTTEKRSASPLWDASHNYMRVLISDFQVEANVGMYAWEKHPEHPTRLSVSVEMFCHIGDELLSHSKPVISYDVISKTLKSWSTRPHTPLLETLVEEVIALCFENKSVQACRVSIVKPDIFNNASAAGVELYRIRPKA